MRKKGPLRPHLPSKGYEGYTWIGNIVGAHGIRGEVRVKTLTDDPSYYLELKQAFIEAQGSLEDVSVEHIRLHKGQWIVKFDRVLDRNEAEGLQWQRLFIEDQDLRPLEDGEYFHHQVIGCRVEDLTGNLLGTVTDILETGANDVYVVRNEDKEFLVPVTDEVLKEIHIEDEKIVIDPIEGLME